MTTLSAGQHAFVTGGGRGIGRAVAAAFAAAGARVTIAGRSRDALADAVTRGNAHAFVVADVTSEQEVRAAIAEANAAQPVDILVANAGGAESAPFMRSDAGLFRRMLDLNLMGVVHCAHAALPGLQQRPAGRIVVIASTAGLKAYPYVTAYCAAKHAAIGFVRALALELASTKITVNAVCPGFTDTDLVAGSLDYIMQKTGRSHDEALAGLVRGNPQGRLVTPQEVADAVLWLCGSGSSAVTGQPIVVAGGEI